MWLTVNDFVNCRGFATTERGCRKILDKYARENPEIRRKRRGTKAYEYNLLCFSEETQQELFKKLAVSVVNSQPKPLPAVRADVDLASLTNKQREIADARIALVQYVLELEQSMSRIKAVNYLCHLANSGELPSHLVALVDVANAKKKAESVISTR
ncbi:hypothetical protein ACWIVT_00005, partial [Ursidibacter arcticus]